MGKQCFYSSTQLVQYSFLHETQLKRAGQFFDGGQKLINPRRPTLNYFSFLSRVHVHLHTPCARVNALNYTRADRACTQSYNITIIVIRRIHSRANNERKNFSIRSFIIAKHYMFMVIWPW